MSWSILIACIASVSWMAGLTLIVRGFAEHEFRRNGYKVRVRK
ncbi:hypothetical protein [Sinorhizobium fredii]|nr:hypothetical protein [Sinorhizobium fredii]